jgi:PhzF family phenazine biosynthesis protein
MHMRLHFFDFLFFKPVCHVMRIAYFQVNAFTRHTYGGNPAGVCPLTEWLPDKILLEIARENNFAETAFFVARDSVYHLRWFTPAVEVDLCGHATVASAHVLFSELPNARKPPDGSTLRFQTRSGQLLAHKRGDLIELDFPSRDPHPCATPEALIHGLGRKPREVVRARDYLALFDSQAEVAALTPDMTQLASLDALGIIATAPGADADFVSRFFAPKVGVPEDPATGSSHSTLIPFWASRLNKSEMFARQISKRGGEFHCRLEGDRVRIGGHALTYCRGEIEIPELPDAG